MLEYIRTRFRWFQSIIFQIVLFILGIYYDLSILDGIWSIWHTLRVHQSSLTSRLQVRLTCSSNSKLFGGKVGNLADSVATVCNRQEESIAPNCKVLIKSLASRLFSKAHQRRTMGQSCWHCLPLPRRIMINDYNDWPKHVWDKYGQVRSSFRGCCECLCQLNQQVCESLIMTMSYSIIYYTQKYRSGLPAHVS